MGNKIIVGVDIGGSSVKWIAGPDPSKPQFSGLVKTKPEDAEETLWNLASDIFDTVDGSISAIGVACAGVINPESSLLGGSPNLPGWQGINLGSIVKKLFPKTPYTITNDVNAALAGEWMYGAGKGQHNLVMFALGTGVGGGLVVNNELVVGANNSAGELGHMILNPDGPLCPCGNRGCLEAYAGARGIMQRAEHISAETVAQLNKLACNGDVEATDIFKETGKYLGIAIGNMINALDPELVIIGGGVAEAWNQFSKECIKNASNIVLGTSVVEKIVVPSALGLNAAAIGVAGLAREHC